MFTRMSYQFIQDEIINSKQIVSKEHCRCQYTTCSLYATRRLFNFYNCSLLLPSRQAGQTKPNQTNRVIKSKVLLNSRNYFNALWEWMYKCEKNEAFTLNAAALEGPTRQQPTDAALFHTSHWVEQFHLSVFRAGFIEYRIQPYSSNIVLFSSPNYILLVTQSTFRLTANIIRR